MRLLDQVEEDAWTRNHALARERPLYRVQADDAERHLLYVSSHSGLVVRDASAHERAWNLLGAWLHWLYPLREVMPKAAWSPLLVYGALLGAVLVLLGMLIGLLRWRFTGRYRNGSHSPYPAGASRVHHVGGLLVGVVLLVWLVSGMLSMEPWGLFEKRSSIDAAALRQAPLNAEALDADLASSLARFREAGIAPVELQWHMLGNQPYLVGLDARAIRAFCPRRPPGLRRNTLSARYWSARSARPGRSSRCTSSGWNRRISITTLAASQAYTAIYRAACRCCGCASTIRPPPGCTSTLQRCRHRTAGSAPACRALGVQLLHSWDWLPLLQRPLLRDGLLLAFSAGALVISLSGVLLGWRRLRPRRGGARCAGSSAAAVVVGGFVAVLLASAGLFVAQLQRGAAARRHSSRAGC